MCNYTYKKFTWWNIKRTIMRRLYIIYDNLRKIWRSYRGWGACQICGRLTDGWICYNCTKEIEVKKKNAT